MEKIGMIKLSSLYNSKMKNYVDLDKQKEEEEEDVVDNSDVWKGELTGRLPAHGQTSKRANKHTDKRT